MRHRLHHLHIKGIITMCLVSYCLQCLTPPELLWASLDLSVWDKMKRGVMRDMRYCWYASLNTGTRVPLLLRVYPCETPCSTAGTLALLLVCLLCCWCAHTHLDFRLLNHVFLVNKYLLLSCFFLTIVTTLSEKKVLSRTLKGSSAQRSAGTLKGSR